MPPSGSSTFKFFLIWPLGKRKEKEGIGSDTCVCAPSTQLKTSGPLAAAPMLSCSSYYSFDIMGDLAFGDSFNMMKDGVDH